MCVFSLFSLSLSLDGCEVFVKIINSDNINKPDIIWNHELRNHMVSCIEMKMVEFRKAFLDNSDSYFEFYEPSNIVYTVYDDKLSVGGVFLDCFMEGQSFQGPVDYSVFLQSLTEELLNMRKAVSKISEGEKTLAKYNLNVNITVPEPPNLTEKTVKILESIR